MKQQLFELVHERILNNIKSDKVNVIKFMVLKEWERLQLINI